MDKANLPDGVRVERKKLLDEAQKADDIEYIMRKYPHLRIAYVDDRTVQGEKVFASVLVKAVVAREQDGQPMPASIVLTQATSAESKQEQLLARARAERVRQEELGGGAGAGAGAEQGAGPSAAVGAGGVMVDNVGLGSEEAGKSNATPEQRLGISAGGAGTGSGTGADGSDIQEIYRIRLPGTVLIGEGKPENQNHAMIFTRGEFLEAIGQKHRETKRN